MSERRELPDGWRWVKLGEVAEYINGRAFKPEEWSRAGLPIIRIENLTSATAPSHCYDGLVEQRVRVRTGDLLISWSATLDAFMWDRGDAVLNQHIFRVEEDPRLVTKQYLYWAVKQAMERIRGRVHGATMRHVTKGEFERTPIILAPLAEQRRIAAVLNEQMAAVERARAAAQAQLDAARALPAAYLRQAFPRPGQPLPDGWRWVKLGEVCEFVRGVTFDKSEAKSTPSLGSLPILRAGNIAEKLQMHDDLVWVPESRVDREQLLLLGDIAICLSSGSPAVVGKTAYCERRWRGSVGAFCGIVRSLEGLDTRYLAHWFRSPSYWQWRDEQARGANIQNLRFSELGRLELPLPPPLEQTRIAWVLNEQMASVERVRAAAEAQLAQISALPAALLRRAFSGEL
ncbi:MAG TPA: restriction endonuclease subunit S [Anaerolineae bacterium]|nr:restriction endonuclease subunit S [Anaerolineae bacterium]HQJ52326.1 restriction endonuclease subunit S [Anaerolineae bacterium]